MASKLGLQPHRVAENHNIAGIGSAATSIVMAPHRHWPKNIRVGAGHFSVDK
jgi:hypothetical protein